MSALIELPVSVVAPLAGRVSVHTSTESFDLAHGGGRWTGRLRVPPGTHYWLTVDDGQPLLDPECAQVAWTAEGPRSVALVWPVGRRLGRRQSSPVIYELHVKGFGGTYRGCIERLPYLAELGVDVIELLPVQPFDSTDNYWGYMPAVWGGVHDGYAVGGDAPAELAELVAAAHTFGIAVWLDVVFNHTGEGAPGAPTWSLRGLNEHGSYLFNGDTVNNDSGCGNTVNPAQPEIRRLVHAALHRFAALGVDGFRFDLASILARDGGELVAQIADWAAAEQVDLVAEPWDLGRYMVGDPEWIEPWQQWNDHFRDDVRGLLRGDFDRVARVAARVQGSPDLFGRRALSTTVNFLTAHDGLTMYDLVATDLPTHLAWSAPEALRPQLIKNAFTVLLLSSGAAMFVAGDEFGRTQGGHPNPYNLDTPVSWVDWSLLDRWSDVHAYVRRLIALRRANSRPVRSVHGLTGEVNTAGYSQSLAWSTGDVYVAVNAWTEPLDVVVEEPGEWRVALSSAPFDGHRVAPRSSVVWVRRGSAVESETEAIHSA